MNIEVGLLQLGGLHLPSAQLDETLYSWCTRFHRLNLGHSPRETSLTLFGHPHAALHHDIPCALAEFAERTDGLLGSSTETLKQRTVFGFHAKFLSSELEATIGRIFAGPDNALGRTKLGLKKAGSLSGRSMFCPECLEVQLREQGFTWWQLAHHLPSAFVCSLHQVPLRSLEIQQCRGRALAFALPSRADSVTSPQNTSGIAEGRLAEITKWGAEILWTDLPRLTDDVLRWCYRLEAKHRGWMAFDGSLRMQELRDSFLSYYGNALQNFDEDILGDLSGVNGGMLASLFRQLPSRRHPLKHVLLLNFLFTHIAQFGEVLHEVRQLLDAEGPTGCEKRMRDSQGKLLRLVQDDGVSLAVPHPPWALR